MAKAKKKTPARKREPKRTKAEIKAFISAHANSWGLTFKEAEAKLLDTGVGRQETLDLQNTKAAKNRKGGKAKAGRKSARKTRPARKAAKATAAPKKAVRKALTAGQKNAKLAKDRDRRAAKKAAKTSNGASAETEAMSILADAGI